MLVRSLVGLAALLLASCDAIGDGVYTTIDQTEWAIATQQFNELCARNAGLTINAASGLGGVEATVPRASEALWLLFDVGAPFVEMERTKSFNVEREMSPWKLVSDDRQVWRFERKPAGDASCAPFHAWLANQKAPRDFLSAVGGRWLDPASYNGECVKFTSKPLSEKTPYGYDADNIRFRTQSETFFLRRVGACGTVSQTNTALVEGASYRLFQVRSLNFIESHGCLTSISGWGNKGYGCGRPTEKNLFAGKTIMVNTSTEAGKNTLDQHQGECRMKAACQGTK